MKRIFIMPYLISLLLALVYGLYGFYANHWELAWLALSASCVPMLLFIYRLSASGKARTRERLYPELIIGAALTLWIWWDGHHQIAALAGVLSVLGVALYDRWYSNLNRTSSPLLGKGEVLPAFTLQQLDGTPFQSHDHIDKPAVWLFIRGNWCPLCVAQVHEVAENYRKLESQGVNIFVISAQPEAQMRKLAEDLNVPLTFLRDVNGDAAKSLKIWHTGGVPAGVMGYDADTTWPTALVTGDNGTILYSAQFSNYRIRPEPEDFLFVLDGYLKEKAQAETPDASETETV